MIILPLSRFRSEYKDQVLQAMQRSRIRNQRANLRVAAGQARSHRDMEQMESSPQKPHQQTTCQGQHAAHTWPPPANRQHQIGYVKSVQRSGVFLTLAPQN